MLYQLDKLTDWLWGLAVYPTVVDMETKLAVKPEQRFFGGTVCLQILYDIRVSSLGFPCHHCLRFVSWEESIWFTRYHKFEEQDPSSESQKNRRALYHPRDYFCFECGHRIVVKRRRRLEEVLFEEVRCDQVSKVYTYRSLRV